MLQPLLIQPELERDWMWRGWRVRYAYRPWSGKAIAPSNPPLKHGAICDESGHDESGHDESGHDESGHDESGHDSARHDPPGVTRDNIPPFLLIHGFGSSWRQWEHNIEALSQYAPVYALDLLGFGGSEKAAIAYNGALWVEQIYDFWTSVIRRPMVLVGHSLGALMAATVAVTHPTIVQRLILVTLPMTRQDMIGARWVQASVGTVERLFTSPVLVRLIFKIARQPGFIRRALRSIYIDRDRVTETVVSNFVNPTLDRGAAQTLCRLTQSATQPDYSVSRSTLLQQLTHPTLVIWGTEDRVVPLAGCQAEIEAAPTVTLVQIPAAGHCVYDEQAEPFNGAITQWLFSGENDAADD